jgi:hypothetical protein
VAGRDAEPAMAAFIDRHDLGGIPHAADLDGAVWEHFGVTAQPAWVFVDGETGQSELVYGELSDDALDERLEALGTR